jgi:hypothetical protein
MDIVRYICLYARMHIYARARAHVCVWVGRGGGGVEVHQHLELTVPLYLRIKPLLKVDFIDNLINRNEMCNFNMNYKIDNKW